MATFKSTEYTNATDGTGGKISLAQKAKYGQSILSLLGKLYHLPMLCRL